jgi:hypothetical protein
MITMLYVIVVGLLVTTGAAMAVIVNTQAATTYELGAFAQATAESGLENGLLRLIRNPAYTGETFAVDTGHTAVVTVASSSGTMIITSTGTVSSVTRQMEARVHYTNGILGIDSWKELP